MHDIVSIIRHSSLRLAKKWMANGTLDSYELARYFTLDEIKINNIKELSSLLFVLSKQYNSCIIRGKYKGDILAQHLAPGDYKPGLVQRQLEYFSDQPLHSLLIDIDNFQMLESETVLVAVKRFIDTRLPGCFADRSYHIQLSNSFGHPSKIGQLRAHLWFWLCKPATYQQLNAWDAQNGLRLDTSTFRVVQPLYTSDPVFDAGLTDPVSPRAAFMAGALGDTVELDLSDLDLSLGVGGERVARGRLAQLNSVASADPVAAHLHASGAVHGTGSKGEIYIECPFSDAHSSNNQDTATCYFPAHTQGYARGHFKCLHASCEGRRDNDYLVKSGYLSIAFNAETVCATGEGLPGALSESQEAFYEWEDRIGNVSNKMLLIDTLAPALGADSRLDTIHRSMLVNSLKIKSKELGAALTIKECRSLASPARPRRVLAPLADWVLVVSQDRFYNISSNTLYKSIGASAEFSRMQLDTGDTSVEEFVKRKVKLVDGLIFWPGKPKVFENDGGTYANLFDPARMPAGRGAVTWEDNMYIHTVCEFIQFLCGQNAKQFTQFLAYCVKHPGDKVLFMPVFIGPYGVGKSTVGLLMRAVLGYSNVNDIKCDSIAEKFNSWMTGGLMGVVEELRQYSGKEKIGVKIKEAVTNDYVAIREMGMNTYNVVNTKNYCGMSNDLDAIDWGAGDRRFWPILTPDSVRDARYFNRLRHVLLSHADLVVGWLLNFDMGGFDAKGHAPKNSDREELIDLCTSEASLIVTNLCAKAAVAGVCEDAFVSVTMRKLVEMEEGRITNWTFAKMIADAGFIKLNKTGKVRIDGLTIIVYVKPSLKNIGNEELRLKLKV